MVLEYYSFSRCGQFFAHCGADGKLKIWDTASDTLKQEYTPNLHLTSPYTCFTWIATKNFQPSSHQKKRRKSEGDGGVPLIAIGTQAGGLVFYSIAEGTIVSALDNGHRTAVQCLTWEQDADLFSCSTEHFVHWESSKKLVKSKWKNGEACTAMAASADGQWLVTAAAGGSVKWWDVSRKVVIRTFAGHSGPVARLEFVCPSLPPSTPSEGDFYVVSAAQNDGLINAWWLSESGPGRAAAAFTVKNVAQGDVPRALSAHATAEGTASVAAVTGDGTLHLFTHQLNGNGKTKKPVKPTLSVAVAADAGQSKAKARPLTIVSVVLSSPSSALVAYGTPPFLAFETISLEHTEKALCLVRKDPKTTITGHQEAVSKVRVPEVSSDTHYLSAATANGVGLGTGMVAGAKRTARGREAEAPMEQRLQNLALDTSLAASAQPGPAGESMANLLIQGLQSKDKSLLQSVLFKGRGDETAVARTVRRLPVAAVAPLVTELVALLHGKTFTSQTAAVWLRAVLSAHAGQLLADATAADAFAPLLTLVEQRLGCRPAMERLRGRLHLMLLARERTDADAFPAEAPALLTVHDQDSTEEGSDTMGSEGDEDESEDRWDELSDATDADDADVPMDSDHSS